MNPTSTSAFALPERLAPRPTPPSSPRDEQQFAAIAGALDQQAAEIVDRLATSVQRLGAGAAARWTGTSRSTT
jgi:hypothetical protein